MQRTYTFDDLSIRRRELMEHYHRTGEPIHILESGEDELVLIRAEDYEKWSLMELRELLAEAEEDERAGRFSPAKEAFSRLEEALKNGTL